MDILTLIIGFALCFLVANRALRVFLKARAARLQIAETTPFEKASEDYARTLLVLGDSTAVGVGADRPEDSVPGRFASYIGATYVENHAKSGAAVEDLKGQIDTAKRRYYDYILIQIGGNDLILLHSAKRTASRLDALMMSLPDAGSIVFMCAGNLGGATFFPLVVRPLHTLLNLDYHKWFGKVAKRRKAFYINLYEPRERDLFIQHPERYLSGDGLHPSGDGYGLWFDKLRAVVPPPAPEIWKG